MEETLRKILEAGTYAPSGDNVQPWKFVVRGDTVELWNVPEKDRSLYNFRQNASMIAHGALVENMVIAGGALGRQVKVSAFPEKDNLEHVATISFQESLPNNDSLLSYIYDRATNRKAYAKNLLTQKQKELFSQSVFAAGGKLVIKDDVPSKEMLASALSANEQLVFENKPLHDFFFGHLYRTNQEIQKAGGGFPIKTLELPGPLPVIFPLFGNWSLLKIFNIMGLSRSVASQNAKTYRASAALCAIVFPTNTRMDFFMGGRAMQRVWLEATRMGLSVQPLTGIFFLWQRLLAQQTKEFSEQHQGYIKNSYKTLERVFGSEGKTIVFVFRIGNGGAPSAITPRLSLDVFIA